MAEFNIQSDSVDVTRIMEQIRLRIQEKRGRDYTEQQIRELATVKLERFLDPQQVRSDLVEHYRRLAPPEPLEPTPHERPGPTPELFDFDEHTIYTSSRGTMGKLIRLIRKLLNPMLKLFFNPTPIVFALTRQAEINAWTVQLMQQQADLAERVTTRASAKFAAREQLDALNYEVLNNLVVEMTRLSVDMKNHRSLVESVAGRLDFDERRARALESVVQSRSTQPPQSDEGEGASSTGSGRSRRRRRRPRRRPGATTPLDAGPNGDTAAVSDAQRDTETAQPVPPPDTATRPMDTAVPHTVPPSRHGATPPPAADPTPDPEPTTPAAPPVADAGAPDPPPTPPPGQRDPPTPPPGQRDPPAPATAPATDTVAPTSPTGDAGTDEQ